MTLCQLKGGCIGCCSFMAKTVADIRKGVERNTKEFLEMNPVTLEDFKKFRDRCKFDDFYLGICNHAVSVDCKLKCPLHPAIHGEDLRETLETDEFICDVNYSCETLKKYETWEEGKKEMFVKFLESRKMDSVSYSRKMYNGVLLRQFEKWIYSKS